MQKYGQHFLVNQGIIDKITNAVLPHLKNAALAEIGPGKGALTLNLLSKGVKDFTLIEIDPLMVEHLQSITEIKNAAVKIIQKNFLEVAPSSLGNKNIVFLSNLPYIDAADILNKVLNFKNFSAAVFMFQREQAQRIMASPGSDFYGPLSLLSRARADIKSLCRVQRGSFSPPPKVESEVLVFTKREYPVLENTKYECFEKTVKAAFAYKRKNILNSLTESLGIEKDKINTALQNSCVSPDARAQQLEEKQFISIANNLTNLLY